MTYPIHITDKTLTAFVNGAPLQTDRSNPQFDHIRDLLNDPTTTSDQLIAAFKPINVVAASLAGVYDVEIVGGDVLVDGNAIDTYLAKRVVEIVAAGFTADPWVKFVQNVYANPFTEAREELYGWLERAQMPITSDGCFLAYKIVGSDYYDRHSHTKTFLVGEATEMPRDDCDNDSRALCSKGLHFCSKDYIPFFGINPGDHLLLVKINPADVVSIPRGETHKGRAWKMEPVAELDPETYQLREWEPVEDYGQEDEAIFDDSVAFVLDVTDFPVEEDEEYEEFEEVSVDDRAGLSFPLPAVDPNQKVVNTKQLGPLTFERFVQLRNDNGGTNVGLADAVGAPAGTVGKWLAKFRAQGCNI